MVLLPLLSRWGGVSQRGAMATGLAAIWPMCAVSATLYALRVRPPLSLVLPCVLGGVVGGIVAGVTFEKVSVRLLRLLFGLFLIYGAVRYLW